jgi:hypothetical protein
VRDDWARSFTEAFVDRWARSGTPTVVALNGVERDAIHGPHGIRHPYQWASYGVLLAGLPPEAVPTPLARAGR